MPSIYCYLAARPACPGPLLPPSRRPRAAMREAAGETLKPEQPTLREDGAQATLSLPGRGRLFPGRCNYLVARLSRLLNSTVPSSIAEKTNTAWLAFLSFSKPNSFGPKKPRVSALTKSRSRCML